MSNLSQFCSKSAHLTSIYQKSANNIVFCFFCGFRPLAEIRGPWSRSILEKESYPYDVNGDVILKLPKGALLQDQWNWSKQMKCTLAKLYIDGKKFIGSSHSQNCKRSFFCSNMTCSFRRETGNVNSSTPKSSRSVQLLQTSHEPQAMFCATLHWKVSELCRSFPLQAARLLPY